MNIVFIINPLSGSGVAAKVEQHIAHYFTEEHFDVGIFHTAYAVHAKELAEEVLQDGANIVVAVGGDGTVNEVAGALVGSDCSLGIVPCGSGNGLARHLGIPLEPTAALQRIASGSQSRIDAMSVNERYSFVVSGTGFDADVAHQFAIAGTRGMITYAKIALAMAWRARSCPYHLSIDGLERVIDATQVSFANTAQHGGGAFVSPQASVTDGLLDLVIMNDMPWWRIPEAFFRLMRGSLPGFKYYQHMLAKEVVMRGGPFRMHIDGEPVNFPGDVRVKVIPSALAVIM